VCGGPVCGLVTLKWQFCDDSRGVLTGRIGRQPLPRPRGWDLVTFLGGKALFFALALGVPLLARPTWLVLLFGGLTSCVLGMTLSVVFQLAHCVEEAAFPLPEGGTGRMGDSWAVHQEIGRASC